MRLNARGRGLVAGPTDHGRAALTGDMARRA